MTNTKTKVRNSNRVPKSQKNFLFPGVFTVAGKEGQNTLDLCVHPSSWHLYKAKGMNPEQIKLRVFVRQNPTPKKPVLFLVDFTTDPGGAYISSLYPEKTRNLFHFDYTGVKYYLHLNPGEGIAQVWEKGGNVYEYQ